MDNNILKIKLEYVIRQLNNGLNDNAEEKDMSDQNKYAYKYGWCSNAVKSALKDLDEIIKVIDEQNN